MTERPISPGPAAQSGSARSAVRRPDEFSLSRNGRDEHDAKVIDALSRLDAKIDDLASAPVKR
jgi:hypothetical protein